MYDEQDIKPSRSFDDIDREIRGQQSPSALKPPKPAKSFDDIDREVRGQDYPPALKPLSPKKEAVRQNVMGLQRELTKPENQVAPNQNLNLVTGQKTVQGSQFTPPVSLDFRGPTEGEKMANRALGTPPAPSLKPKPMRTAMPLAPRPSTLERIQNQQAIERHQPETVETDPAKMEAIRQNTAESLAYRQRRQAEETANRNRTLRQIGGALNPAVGLGNTLNDAGVPDVNRVLQSSGKGVGSMLRGAAEASTMYPGAEGMYKFVTGNSLRDTANRYGQQAERLTNQASEALLPEQAQDQSFRAKLERGAGSILPPVGAALATGGGSAVSAGIGALTNLGQVASERDASGVPVSDTRRALSNTLAVATGMTEALGIGRMLDRVGLKTPLVHRVAQMIEEGGQEYAQDYLNDINAKLVAAYDPQRQINDPLAAKRLESAAIGAILGGAGEVADVGAQRIQQGLENRQIAQNRNIIDARSAANARAITQPTAPPMRPAMLGPTQITPAPKPEAATPQENAQITPTPEAALAALPVPSDAAPAFPRLPEPEGFNARRAKLLGMDVPAEVGINERVQAANQLLTSTNAGDQQDARNMLKKALRDLRQSEGYLAELKLPEDAPKPFTAVRDAIEAKLSSGTLNKKPSNPIESKAAPKVGETTASQIPESSAVESAPTSSLPAMQTVTGALRAEADAAKIKAAEFEQSGDFANAAQTYDTTHKNLKLLRRKLGVPKTAEDVARINQIDREISAAASNRQRATAQARQMTRQANAPTAGLSEKRIDISDRNRPQSTESAPLLRPEAVQNPEGGIPQMPEQTFTGRLEQGIRRDQAAQQSIKGSTEDLTIGGMLKRRFPEGIRLADKGEARNLGGREGNALVGLVNKNSRVGVDDVAYALHEEGLRLPDGRPFVEDGRVTATEADVLDFLKSSSKQKVGGTRSLAKNLEQQEAEYYAQQEESTPARAEQSFKWDDKERTYKTRNEYGDEWVEKNYQKGEGKWKVSDDLGGSAFGDIRDGVANIVGMESIPIGKRYTSEEGNFKRRGFFRQLIQTLQANGAKSIEIRLQSADTQAAVRRLLETGELVNPREVRGSSDSKHPTLFDIPQRQQPSKSFDEIAADVDSETGALQRAIDRSNERGHVIQEPGVGLVSMSPYADMVARNQDAVDRLYQSGLASPEGKEIFRNLREFAAKNGIEARHLHALADDVRNHELEKARWADKGIDFSTVQSLDEGTARLGNSILEEGKSLPDVERTALEREVAALDALFEDTDATNLLARAAEGDNNAANEFRKTASEYGIGADTIGDLIQARTSDRSANRAARQAEARTPQGTGRDTRTVSEREARSATPEEFDLLNRNPATIPNDEMDAHLRALEKLRNDNIRGIVKLAKDDLRELRRALKNTNDERQFRVKQKQLGPKNEPRYVPTMEERRAKWAEEAKNTKTNSIVLDEAENLRQEWGILKTFDKSNIQGAIDNARVQTSTDPANKRAGIIYVNSNAKAVIDEIWSANGGAEFSAAVALDIPALEAVSDVLRHEASFLEGNDAKQITALADAFSGIVSAKYDGAGLINVDLANSGHLDLARNHEMFHVWQYGQSQPNDVTRKPMDVKWAEKVNGYEKVRATLTEKGYPDDAEDIVREFAAYSATNDLERLGFSKQEAETVATDFLYEYFTQISKQYGAEHLERIGRVSIPARAVAERVRNEIRSTQTASKTASESRVSQQEPRSAGSVAVSGIRLPGREEGRRRSGSETGDTEKAAPKEKRFSFGSLPSEPQGQLAASGLGGLQDLFSRKPKPKAAQPVPVPSKFNLGDWSQKFYRDAMAAGLDKTDRAAYDAAKTPREKTAVLMSAKVDAKREQSIYDIIDKASDAATKNDGSALYDALSDATDMMRRQPTERGFARVKQEAGNALSVPRSLMASADISAPFRQGSLLTLPPSQWGKAAKATVRMFQAFNSEQYKQISKEINLHPDAETARDAGLYISTDKSGLVTKKEEDFLSNWTEKIPLVKQSEQAYKTYLDSLRMDTFARYKKSIDKTKGLSAEQKEAAYKAAADWINVATGRGTLGETFESAMPVLSKVFFAPRYTASRIQVLNPMTYAKNARTAEGRAVLKNQMADMVQYAGVISATLALAAANGATVGLDPDDADFLKIKVGNTRYDVLAGLQQPMRLFYRMGESLYGRATGEKTKGNQSTLDIASRFGRSKLAPVPSFVVDYLSGKDFTGQDFNLSKAIVDRVAPLMWKDFYDAYQKEGLAGGLKILPGITGIGVQNYGEKPNILKPSAFSKAATDKGMKIETLKMKQGEPEAVFNQRKQRVEGWMDEYGQKLLDSPRYKAMTADEQKAAMQLLRARIGRQQNLKQPKPNSFEPNAVLLGVKKSAATKARRQSKYLYQP